MPRIAAACSKASSGVLAIFTPPALPRPPALTCALITVTPPISSAAALASSAVSTIVAERRRHAVLGEELLRLVLHQVHGSTAPSMSGRGWPRPTLVPRARGGERRVRRVKREETQVTPLVSPPVTLARHRVRRPRRRHPRAAGARLPRRPADVGAGRRGAARRLARDHLRRPRRRAGRREPQGRSSYRTSLLVEDLIAVLDATLPPGEQVHLVAHDWGSIAGWDVRRRRDLGPAARGPAGVVHLEQRSVAGPPRQPCVEPWSGRLRLLPAGAAQLVRLALPGPLAARARLAARSSGLLRRLDRAASTRPSTLLPVGTRGAARTPAHSIDLYRANVIPRLREPLPWRTSVPCSCSSRRRDFWVSPRVGGRAGGPLPRPDARRGRRRPLAARGPPRRSSRGSCTEFVRVVEPL